MIRLEVLYLLTTFMTDMIRIPFFSAGSWK